MQVAVVGILKGRHVQQTRLDLHGNVFLYALLLSEIAQQIGRRALDYGIMRAYVEQQTQNI